MVASAGDEWAWALDAARRDVLSAHAAVSEVRQRAMALTAAMGWASPAMRAFQEQADAWREELGAQLCALESADDRLAAWRSYLLVHGRELFPVDIEAWLIEGAAERQGAAGRP